MEYMLFHHRIVMPKVYRSIGWRARQIICSLRQHGTFLLSRFLIIALAERNNQETIRIMKYRSAACPEPVEGKAKMASWMRGRKSYHLRPAAATKKASTPLSTPDHRTFSANYMPSWAELRDSWSANDRARSIGG